MTPQYSIFFRPDGSGDAIAIDWSAMFTSTDVAFGLHGEGSYEIREWPKCLEGWWPEKKPETPGELK